MKLVAKRLRAVVLQVKLNVGSPLTEDRKWLTLKV
jgi:hypothetical protein